MYFTPSAGALLRKSTLSNCENESEENRMRAADRKPILLKSRFFIVRILVQVKFI
jgi:hypothetical protein